ncbi:MAG: class I SAM-dependent methyltransferase [Actinomycetota bacterium]|nr:class I SAM-dependent methyltransferase [Actinomycetota bacterium]
MPESEPEAQKAANRALWDKWTKVHLEGDFYHVDSFKAGDSRLRDYEIEEVGGVAGKDLLHLQCHFGLDTLSWARLGARVTGADYSEAAVAEARKLAVEVGLEARFVCSDVYDLSGVLEGDFDIVYTSRGVLGWLPDIEGWADVVAHFVRPGGLFYITEVHPFAQVFDDDESITELRVKYPYFSQAEALTFPVQGSYADRGARVEHDFEYGWNHSLGEIVTALASRGLRIEFLHEFPFLEWPSPYYVPIGDERYVLPDSQEGETPSFFSLKATKPLAY